MECKGVENIGKEDDKRDFLKRSHEKQVVSFVMSLEKSGLMITRGCSLGIHELSFSSTSFLHIAEIGMTMCFGKMVHFKRLEMGF